MSDHRPVSGGAVPSAPLHLVTILYHSSKSFQGFLNGLKAQDRGDWRLHVIDNGDPESVAILGAQADPRISLSHNSGNIGFARAANQGVRQALAEGANAVVLINNDIIMPPDLLNALGEAERQLPGAVMCPRIMEADQPDVCSYAGGSIKKTWVYQNVPFPYDPAVTEPQRVEFAPGCCLLISASALAKVGLLDERFFVYWEDSDFSLRLNQAGIPIYYLPTISILHKGRESTGGQFSSTYYKLFYTSYMQFLRKHFGLSHAVATMLRLTRRDWERKNFADFGVRTRAMLLGLVR
ncbi:MAG TPA: glycosyltransferase family 2 protein [Rhizomicrobium sp.]